MATQHTFGWPELAKTLFKARGITTGLWRIGVGFRLAAANTGPNNDAMMPSGILAIESVVLFPAEEDGPLVFDAAVAAAMPEASPPRRKVILVKKKPLQSPKS